MLSPLSFCSLFGTSSNLLELREQLAGLLCAEAMGPTDTLINSEPKSSVGAASEPTEGHSPVSNEAKLEQKIPAAEVTQPDHQGIEDTGSSSSSSSAAESRPVKPLYHWVLAKLSQPVRRWTVGTARVDIKRPCVSHASSDESIWQAGGTPVMGSRMKLMRDIHLWDKAVGGAPLFRVGFGCQFELEPNNKNSFTFQARARVSKFATLKLLPQPALKLHYSLPLLDTGLVATMQYYCPFVEDLHSPIHPPATLMLRLDNRAGSGVHFSPMGVELDERIVGLNDTTSIRVAAGIGFPRQMPMPEGDSFRCRIHRLGLKTRW